MDKARQRCHERNKALKKAAKRTEGEKTKTLPMEEP